jgi:hypothetical protein
MYRPDFHVLAWRISACWFSAHGIDGNRVLNDGFSLAVGSVKPYNVVEVLSEANALAFS